MKVLLTGADGLLGSSTARALLAAGHQVTVFLQDGKASPTLEGLPLTRMYGDLLDYDSVLKACRGCQGVIHAGASTSVWPSRSDMVQRVNVLGTKHIIDACEAVQVDRLVYIGSASSFTPGTKEHPGDESTPYGCGKYGLDYNDSKYRAMQLVLYAVGERSLPALTLHPGFMIGPWDSLPSSGAMVAALYQGRIRGYTGGGKCWVYSGDAARAAVCALQAGRIGESYIIGNENLGYREFFRIASEVMGVPAPRIHLPRPAVLAAGVLGSMWGTVSGRKPLLNLPMARIACDGHYYLSKKAREELSLGKTPIAQAVSESFTWLKKNRYLDRRS